MGSDDQTPQNALPVIHFNSENLTTCWLATSQKVRFALESHGCFVAVVNETISWETHQKMSDLSKDLFDLPAEIKVKNTSEHLGFGYGGNFPTLPLLEFLGITITNGGATTTLEATKAFANLIWPDGNDKFLVWSNGRVYAPLQQVIMGGSEKKYNIGLSPFMRGTLPVPEELVDDENPLQFKPFNHVAYLSYCGGKYVNPCHRAVKDFCGV